MEGNSLFKNPFLWTFFQNRGDILDKLLDWANEPDNEVLVFEGISLSISAFVDCQKIIRIYV